MDWMEYQLPPPSWHDAGEIIPNGPGDESFCSLTSMVRRCYLKYLEQTLVQNCESCKAKTIQPSALQDCILHWEQNALRACMMTAIYQRAMLQVINAIKSDTKERKLASVLTASITKFKPQHLIDVSTQTEAIATTEPLSSRLHGPISKSDSGAQAVMRKVKREPSLNKESSVSSSDGPFLTPPSDYPPSNVHVMNSTKDCVQNFPRRQPTYASQGVPVESAVFPIPVLSGGRTPSYPALSHNLYPSQNTTGNNCAWETEFDTFVTESARAEAEFSIAREPQEAIMAFNAHEFHNGPTACAHSTDQNSSIVAGLTSVDVKSRISRHGSDQPQTDDSKPYQMQLCEEDRTKDTQFGQVNVEVKKSPSYQDAEFALGLTDVPEPDYNWDQIEEEMARLCGQVFTEADSHPITQKPEIKVPALPEPPNNWEVLEALQDEELQHRLEELRQVGSLERQAKLKRKFIELFGRDVNEDDQTSQVSAKEAVKCKQRIAPWVVKHLMPLYKQKRIASRHLFKSLAKHISDLLIERKLYPDECDVWMGVQEFFSSGTIIECEADFCG